MILAHFGVFCICVIFVHSYFCIHLHPFYSITMCDFERLEGASLSEPPLLTKDNYSSWKVRMEAFLSNIDEHVWMCVEDGYSPPIERLENGTCVPKPKSKWSIDELETEEWNSKGIRALSCAVDEIQAKLIRTTQDVREAWEILRVTHEGTVKEKAKIMGTLKMQLHCSDCGGYGHISTDCGNLKTKNRRGKSKDYSCSERKESSSRFERCDRYDIAFPAFHDDNLKATTIHLSLMVNNKEASSNDDHLESTSGGSFYEESSSPMNLSDEGLDYEDFMGSFQRSLKKKDEEIKKLKKENL